MGFRIELRPCKESSNPFVKVFTKGLGGVRFRYVTTGGCVEYGQSCSLIHRAGGIESSSECEFETAAFRKDLHFFPAHWRTTLVVKL